MAISSLGHSGSTCEHPWRPVEEAWSRGCWRQALGEWGRGTSGGSPWPEGAVSCSLSRRRTTASRSATCPCTC